METTSRGRLTIYLGAAPGVGKTCAMLERGQALRRAGQTVVIGVALTHGRSETAALLDGFERLPERVSDDQGVRVAEFDVAAALRRKPRVVLLDELAHSNAPGSRHAKRWQDAEDLIDAGIDVLTTLNIQHVESLHEPVARLTGVDVRERIPDTVLERATAIELIDLPSDELLTRLKDGKVYLGDGAQRALDGFFTPENLAGLRELALRYVASRVQARQASNGLAPGRQPTERILVAVGPSPTSAWLLRSAKRMADATGAEWLAVHAESPRTLHLDADARSRIGEHLRLAEQLGAQTLSVSGDDLAEVLVDTARRHGARRILVGKPRRGRLWDLWRGSLVHDLIRVSGDIDVLAITGEAMSAPVLRPPVEPETRISAHPWRIWAITCAALIGAVMLTLPLRTHLEPANLTLPFLMAVVVVALLGQRSPVVVATVVGVLAFDVLCVPPYGSLAVSDTEYLLTFLGMLVVGLTIAHLVARLRGQADYALREAEGASALHRLGAGLATTRGNEQMIATAKALTSDILDCRTVIMLTDRPGSASLSHEAILRLGDGDGDSAGDESVAELPPSDVAVAQWVASHGQPAGTGTDTLPSAHGLHLPLLAGEETVGVLVCVAIAPRHIHDPGWRRLAEAAARLIALALACERLHAQAGEEHLRAEREHLRATLLAGVSHDLRTPLTAIAGLAQQLTQDADAERRSIATTIAEQAERLATTVRNLLELTRLGGGSVRPRRVLIAAEDALATAVAAIRPRAGNRAFIITAQDCPPIWADETLLHTALINLLDNAVTHGAGTIELTAHAAADPQQIVITIADHGPGIPDDEKASIFDAWQRGRSAKPGGAGLGLALVQAIITAHGGQVAVSNRGGRSLADSGSLTNSGAIFTCILPRYDDT